MCTCVYTALYIDIATCIKSYPVPQYLLKSSGDILVSVCVSNNGEKVNKHRFVSSRTVHVHDNQSYVCYKIFEGEELMHGEPNTLQICMYTLLLILIAFLLNNAIAVLRLFHNLQLWANTKHFAARKKKVLTVHSSITCPTLFHLEIKCYLRSTKCLCHVTHSRQDLCSCMRAISMFT